jgi:hypothetical protein
VAMLPTRNTSLRLQLPRLFLSSRMRAEYTRP